MDAVGRTEWDVAAVDRKFRKSSIKINHEWERVLEFHVNDDGCLIATVGCKGGIRAQPVKTMAGPNLPTAINLPYTPIEAGWYEYKGGDPVLILRKLTKSFAVGLNPGSWKGLFVCEGSLEQAELSNLLLEKPITKGDWKNQGPFAFKWARVGNFIYFMAERVGIFDSSSTRVVVTHPVLLNPVRKLLGDECQISC